jgi:hypothetical protein
MKLFSLFKSKPNEVKTDEQTKICKGCQKALPLWRFQFHNVAKDKLQAKCAKCRSPYKKQQRKEGDKAKKCESTTSITIKNVPLETHRQLVKISADRKVRLKEVYAEALSQFIMLNTK